MLATSKTVLFPGHIHLLTNGTIDLTLWLSPEHQQVKGHQYRWLAGGWLWPGNMTFLEWLAWWLPAGSWLFHEVVTGTHTWEMSPQWEYSAPKCTDRRVFFFWGGVGVGGMLTSTGAYCWTGCGHFTWRCWAFLRTCLLKLWLAHSVQSCHRSFRCYKHKATLNE